MPILVVVFVKSYPLVDSVVKFAARTYHSTQAPHHHGGMPPVAIVGKYGLDRSVVVLAILLLLNINDKTLRSLQTCRLLYQRGPYIVSAPDLYQHLALVQ